MGETDGLWGPPDNLKADKSSHPLGFEDSFSPENNNAPEAANSPTNDKYVPLQDSQQYLAGLESKLARVQGKTSSSRKAESRRLLDALAGSRSTHTAQLMQNNDTSCSSLPVTDAAPVASTIHPQGALGAMLRRVAPDKVALTPEELCHLLQADLLAQMHESDTNASEESQVAARDTISKSNTATRKRDDTSNNLQDTGEPKEPSSDEGEK